MCYRDGSGGTSAWSTFCHFAKFLIYCHLPKQDAMNFFVSVNELVTETPNVVRIYFWMFSFSLCSMAVVIQTCFPYTFALKKALCFIGEQSTIMFRNW